MSGDPQHRERVLIDHRILRKWLGLRPASQVPGYRRGVLAGTYASSAVPPLPGNPFDWRRAFPATFRRVRSPVWPVVGDVEVEVGRKVKA